MSNLKEILSKSISRLDSSVEGLLTIENNYHDVINSYHAIQGNLICSDTSGTDAVIVITKVKTIVDSVFKKNPRRQYKSISNCLDVVLEAKETLKDLLPSAPGIFSKTTDAVLSMNNSALVIGPTSKKRKKCNYYHVCYPNNNNNLLCQLNPISKCVSCKGEKKYGGFFCSRNDCDNFVGDILSKLYRRHCKNLDFFRRNKDEDERTINLDEQAAIAFGTDRILNKIKTIKALDGCYSGDEMLSKIKDLEDQKRIHHGHVKELYYKIRYHGYYILKELFHQLVDEKMRNLIESFDRFYEAREDFIQDPVQDVFNEQYLETYLSDASSDSNEDENDSNN